MPDLDQTLDLPSDDDEPHGAGLDDPTPDSPTLGDRTLDLPAEDDAVPGVYTLDLSPGDEQTNRSVSQSEDSLPGYRLIRCLGSGASGNVWSAIQDSTEQKVAVKVLKRLSLADDQQLRREMRQLVKLRGHNHVVALLDANLNHQPPFLVMPLLPQSLEHYTGSSVNWKLLRLERVVTWFEQLASALRYVHQRGVLHCDVKPPNILLDRDLAKIVDFGQAALLGEGRGALGTFWYMPPEQASSALDESVQPEAVWDVYALGATIYHLLTGSVPRHSRLSETELSSASSVPEQLKAYPECLRKCPLRPVREQNDKCDEDLAAIVETCLQLDPTKRYQDMGQVVDELERRRTKRPLRCRPPTASYLTRRFLARHPLLVFVVTCCAVLLTGAFLRVRAEYQEVDRQMRLVAEAKAVSDSQLAAVRYAEAVSRIEAGQSSGIALLANLLHERPALRAYRSQLADAVRYLPLPTESTSANWVTWAGADQLQMAGGKLTLPDSRTVQVERDNSSLALSPDAQLTVAWHAQGWQLIDLEKLQILKSERSDVTQVILSNRNFLVVNDKTAQLWQTSPPRELATIHHHATINDAKFSRNGELLATVSDDRTCRVWTNDGTPVGKPLWHDDTVECVEFDPSAKKLMTGSRDKMAREWSLQNWRTSRPPLAHSATVTRVGYSADGKRRVTTSAGQTKVWGDSPQPITLSHSGPVTSAAFSPQGDKLVTSSQNLVYLWSAITGEPLYNPLEMQGVVLAANFDASGTKLLTGSSSKNWRTWDLSSVSPRPEPIQVGRGLVEAFFSPDGTQIVALADAHVRFFDSRSGLEQGRAIWQPGLYGALLSPNGSSMLALGWRAHLWKLGTSQSQLVHPGAVLRPRPKIAAFGPAGKMVAVAVHDELQMWEVGTAKLHSAVKFPGIAWVSFSPDGKSVLASAESSSMLLDLNANTTTRIPIAMTDAKFGEGGQTLLCLTKRGLEKLDLTGTHKPKLLLGNRSVVLNPGAGPHAVPTPQGAELRDSDGAQVAPRSKLSSSGPYQLVVFSPDGSLLVTAAGQRVRVWSGLDGSPVSGWLEHKEQLRSLAVTQDNSILCCAVADGTVVRWELAFDQDMPEDLMRAEAFRFSGWRVDPKLNPRPFLHSGQEWQRLAKDHAKRCQYPEFNAYLRLHPPD